MLLSSFSFVISWVLLLIIVSPVHNSLGSFFFHCYHVNIAIISYQACCIWQIRLCSVYERYLFLLLQYTVTRYVHVQPALVYMTRIVEQKGWNSMRTSSLASRDFPPAISFDLPPASASLRAPRSAPLSCVCTSLQQKEKKNVTKTNRPCLKAKKTASEKNLRLFIIREFLEDSRRKQAKEFVVNGH